LTTCCGIVVLVVELVGPVVEVPPGVEVVDFDGAVDEGALVAVDVVDEFARVVEVVGGRGLVVVVVGLLVVVEGRDTTVLVVAAEALGAPAIAAMIELLTIATSAITRCVEPRVATRPP
jgi:hypothetical protein